MKTYIIPTVKIAELNLLSICAGSEKMELSNEKGDNNEAVMSKHNAIFDME